MKFYGTYELIKHKISIRVKCWNDDKTLDLTFDCNDDQHITLSLSDKQLIDLYEVVSEAVEVHTEHEMPYHV